MFEGVVAEDAQFLYKHHETSHALQRKPRQMDQQAHTDLQLVFFELLLRELAHEPGDVHCQKLFDAVQVLLRQLGKLGEVLLLRGWGFKGGAVFRQEGSQKDELEPSEGLSPGKTRD